MRILLDPLIRWGILILLLAIPLRTSSVEKIEYKKIEESVLYAAHPVYIEPKNEYKTANHKILKQYASPLGSNCYTYAASKKDIGTGFGSLAQKKTKIKTKTPTVGAVGISAEGPVGHLFYVEKILESDLIISEGNYKHSFVTWRIIPKSMALGFL